MADTGILEIEFNGTVKPLCAGDEAIHRTVRLLVEDEPSRQFDPTPQTRQFGSHPVRSRNLLCEPLRESFLIQFRDEADLPVRFI